MASGQDEVSPELCDLCGAVIEDGSEVYATVRDSSAIHAHDARYDGERLVVACSQDHLGELMRQYRERPFVDAELWAGKIARAMLAHPQGMSAEVIAAETGLGPGQIDLAVLWNNLEAARWHEKFGDGPDGGDGEAPW